MPGSASREELIQQIKALEEEKRELEARLFNYQCNEERFQRLLNSTEEGYFEVNLAGDLTFFNNAVNEIFGYSREELKRKNNREYTTPETARRMYQIFNQVYQTGEPAEITDYEIIRKNGEHRYLELSTYLIHDENGQPAGFGGVGRDITERKRNEAALRKSRVRYRELYKEAHQAEELYQSLLDNSPDAIVLLGADQSVRYINSAFTHLFGWTRDSLHNRAIPYIPHPQKEWFLGLLQNLVESGEPLHGKEIQALTQDGRFLDISVSAARYLDYKGSTAGVLVILRDITEAKRYQWHMHQAQKMESIGTMAGGIAHDFNNLLMGIQGRLSLILMQVDAGGKQYAHLKEIEDYTARAAELTQQLLDFAREEKLEAQPTNINLLVHTQNQLFGRTQKEMIIHEDFYEDLWSAEVNPHQIDQVLLNLYVNAAHAMPNGGNLYVKTSNEHLGSTRTQPYEAEPGNYVKISVTDTGIGMDAAVQQRVFEPFFTTKERGRGTGLGLASAYSIIKNHAGFITLYSVKEKGTTFNIYLPASTLEAVEQDAGIHELISGEGTILLVDDEEMIIEVGEEMLRTIGYDVISAARGQEAVDILKNGTETVDLVILDLIMPEMNGSETFGKLRSIKPDIKVLLSSGYSLNGQADELIQRGCNGFIQKPFNLVELSRKLYNILNEVN